jgi:hypothetical protein
MRAILELREGFPQQTYDRCAHHTGFHLHEGAPVEAVRETPDGLILRTARGDIPADFIICATGILVDFTSPAELKRGAHNIACWADRYTPPPYERNLRLHAFPYLSDDYAPFAPVAAVGDMITGTVAILLVLVLSLEFKARTLWLSFVHLSVSSLRGRVHS